MSHTALNKPSGHIVRCVSTIQKPKRNPHEAHSPKYIFMTWLLDPNVIGLIKGSSWSLNSEQPSTQAAVDNLFVGPKGQKTQLAVMGSMSVASGAHIMSSFH